MIELAKVYRPKEVEERLYRFWEGQGYFHAQPNPKKRPFSIVIPPPNVTGILHMGHALNNTIQDILIRWRRMQGYETLWMPGTDHAGIATQNAVEKALAKEGKRRQDLGREAFIQRVWEWKEKYGSTIIQQLKRLGAGCDWERTRFTMDEGLSQAVQEVFIRLYHKGLIYRGNYIINGCPRCQTALSDEEAVHQEVEGRLYYIRYPLKEGLEHRTWKTPSFVVVATTRPETLLGDVAVAVNPKDKRYRSLKGAILILPILGREIKVIEDNFVDPKFGTGAVKVTPAHDPNDFAMALRHQLEPINVMESDGRLNENAGPRYSGKDRFSARDEIVEQLQQEGLLEKIEPHKHAVGHCYRCHTIVEPRLSLQWFVRMKPLAKPAIRVVKEGKLEFVPTRWTKIYLNWLENVRDWCISRQIWWGHRIPVWYCLECQRTATHPVDGCPSVQRSEDKKQETVNHQPAEKLGINVPTQSGEIPQKCKDCGSSNLIQDEDVLDTWFSSWHTWFSSWLWPFSTMGWPEKTRKQKAESRRQKREEEIEGLLDYFYSTHVLVTAPEILFFWVARMVMAGFEFMQEQPFRHVYIHGTVRDITGKKMSKSLGNIIDPLDVIEHVGADALRFSLMTMAAQGTDIFLSEQKFEMGRNFANKIWNASRFILINLNMTPASVSHAERGTQIPEPLAPKDQGSLLTAQHPAPSTSHLALSTSLPDRWILSRLNHTVGNVTRVLEKFQFNEACKSIYEFFWHEFCDWYLEISKPRIQEPQVQAILIHVLETSLRLLHPFMPFETEEIWQILTGQGGQTDPPPTTNQQESIMVAEWPNVNRERLDSKSEKEMELLIQVIVSIRNLRAEFNIPMDKRPSVIISGKVQKELKSIRQHSGIIQQLAQLRELKCDAKPDRISQVAMDIVGSLQIYLCLEGIIDLALERERLSKQVQAIEQELQRFSQRLTDRQFLEKAPKEIVEKERTKREELKAKLERLKQHLAGFQ